EAIVRKHIADGGGGNWFCATFFYEMCWNFIGLIFCLVFWKKDKNLKYPGFMLIFYFFWYMLGRFWLEFLRVDAVPVTKVLCGVVAPIAAIFGTVYILYCNSRASYKHVRSIAQAGISKDTALTEFDIKNYKFVGKLYAIKKNPLKYLYGKEEFLTVDFDGAEFYHVPKHYKNRFRQFKKTEAFSR
ncbi:MAG: prolipoprotein diacylglyceryl transferase, partial [Clostridia bacterium]|nr:prolipoprotein diacylglyceryl transferase [Clostridia bacterium]